MDDKLVKAAKDAIRVYSWKFTMDQVAKSLHISKATLYQKAPSKEALIGMVVDDLMKRFELAETAIADGSDTAEGKILAYTELFVNYFWELPDQVYLDIEIHYPAIWQTWFAFKKEKFGDMMKFLEDAVDKGQLRPVNLPALRAILMGACHALNDPDFLRENNMTGADAMKELEDIILRGIQIRK